jgi:hypothetical protein
MLPVGIHKGIPFAEYNAHPAARSSHLKILLDETPADLKTVLENPDQENSAALLKGEVLHAMLLEPHTVEHRFIFEKTPLKDKTKLEKNGGSKERWDEMKAQAAAYGRVIVGHDIYQECIGMTETVRKSPLWDRVERFADKELTLIADIDGVRCKVRLDAFLAPINMPGVIIDLKTTSKGLSDREIQKTIIEREYQFSAGMYCTVAETLGLSVAGFRWLFIQSEMPYQWRIIDASESMIERGKREFRKALEIYRMSAETNNWSGYFGNRIETIDLPDWYPKRRYSWGAFE